MISLCSSLQTIFGFLADIKYISEKEKSQRQLYSLKFCENWQLGREISTSVPNKGNAGNEKTAIWRLPLSQST